MNKTNLFFFFGNLIVAIIIFYQFRCYVDNNVNHLTNKINMIRIENYAHECFAHDVCDDLDRVLEKNRKKGLKKEKTHDEHVISTQ